MITIVSGLPRSGTSLLMQMLGAGGMPVLTDGVRAPDADNPRGYCEWEPAKSLPRNPALIAQAEGKAVKVISELLFSLPGGRDYRLIFAERPLAEILASQRQMLERGGQRSAANPSDEQVDAAFREHLRELAAWLAGREDIAVCRMGYRKLLADPLGCARNLREFLGGGLNVEAMARAVDPALYRQRGTQRR